MTKKPRHKPTSLPSAVTGKPVPTIGVPVQPVQLAATHYQGPIPPPSILEGFDRLVPGAAQRLIQLAEDESKHRRHLENKTLEANIAAQRRQLEIGDYQSKAVFKSDLLAQVCGVLVTLTCIASAIWASLQGQVTVAVILAGIPTAAVIQAFFRKKPDQKK